MEALIILLSLLMAILVLWVDYLIAKEFYKAAQYKGYSEKKYLWICFWLGVVGYLLVVALPDRGASINVVSDELPDL